MSYSASWRSPSNIALVKYWGKRDIQLPENPSLSFTLSECVSVTTLEVNPDDASGSLAVFFDGALQPAFEPKIRAFFSRIADRFTWLNTSSIVVRSHNTFPHSAGIASSASAMSALALCIKDVDDQMAGEALTHNVDWWQEVSEISRLGSGSACRSVFSHAALWGQATGIKESSDHYAIPWADKLAPVYKDFRDTILIISAGEKSVSSTAGHALMNDLPYATARYRTARQNVERLSAVMQSDDSLDEFITICESEALQLHALMMSGEKPFMLMEPGTISVIKSLWHFRAETKIPVCFTLDAGPNVHLLYPASHADKVMNWIRTELVQYCDGGRFIEDRVGEGPEKI